jgi:putative ABC transport system substrate-binding protein
MQVEFIPVESPDKLPIALERVVSARPQVLMTLPDGMLLGLAERIGAFTVARRLPGIFPERDFVEAGGLMAYGPSLAANFHRAAAFVDKILKGTKPADLPVEQPTKFELFINLKTSKALGLDVPPTLLARADEVIE